MLMPDASPTGSLYWDRLSTRRFDDSLPAWHVKSAVVVDSLTQDLLEAHSQSASVIRERLQKIVHSDESLRGLNAFPVLEDDGFQAAQLRSTGELASLVNPPAVLMDDQELDSYYTALSLNMTSDTAPTESLDRDRKRDRSSEYVDPRSSKQARTGDAFAEVYHHDYTVHGA